MKKISTVEAKNKLSKVIAGAAEAGEVYVITKNGKERAVIISYKEFQRLSAKQGSFNEFLLSSPLRNAILDLTRFKEAEGKTFNFK